MSQVLDHHNYMARSVSSLGVRTVAGWRLKLYGITPDGGPVHESLVPAALAVAGVFLPAPAVSWDRHGVGMITIQDEGKVAGVFLDYWTRDAELVRQGFLSLRALPAQLRPICDDGPVGYVWDLAGVLEHERTAFIRHVLAPAEGPDLDGYLADVLEGDL